MNSKIITIIITSYAYGFFEFYVGLRQRRRGEVTQSGDKGSIWLLTLSIAIGYALSFGIGAAGIGRMGHSTAFFAVGVALIIVGLGIRVYSIKTLKQQFTYTITQVENHTLIESGLYKRIRHPGYLGQLIIFAGIAVGLSNWLSIVLMMSPILLGYSYRISAEERFMREQFGDEYAGYQKRTARLIPMVY